MQVISVELNGELRELPQGTTVAALLETLGIDPLRAAVEVNEHIIPREAHGRTELAAGDALEVVTLVGGG